MSDDAAFEALVEPISEALADEMFGVSWHPDCPVPISDLRLITMEHWGFDDRVHRGELVVHEDVAHRVVSVFGRLFAARFPILRMERIERFGGDDDASMAADNTSAFNCRPITGGSGYSVHSWGMAIDINPLENPYLRDGVVLPPAGSAYLDRDDVRQGMIVAGDVVVEAFAAIGFSWGGDWDRLKDYQHFEVPDPTAATPATDTETGLVVDTQSGVLDTASFNEFLSTTGPPVSASPFDATRVLLGLDRARDDSETVLLVVEPAHPGRVTVTVTIDNLADDSVAAVRYLLRFAEHGDGTVRLASGMWSQRCQPGRGHQDFTTELCV